MKSTIRCLLAAAVATGGAGCSKQSVTQAPAVTISDRKGSPVAPLLGRWTGPEATFLLVEARGAGYAVTVQNLDGPRTFAARAAGNAITFQRDGKTMAIRPTNGAGTGMKWLAERRDCVVIEAGEGYCR